LTPSKAARHCYFGPFSRGNQPQNSFLTSADKKRPQNSNKIDTRKIWFCIGAMSIFLLTWQ
jgi:hypothetical protein